MSRRVSSAERMGGFTLVELMIVVAIIGTLAAIAIPKLANAVRTANEGSTRGGLGSLRSAITIYYGDQEGNYPSDMTPLLTPGSKYLNSSLSVYTAAHGLSRNVNYVDNLDNEDTGNWAYVNSGDNKGRIYVQCTHTDAKGTQWNQY